MIWAKNMERKNEELKNSKREIRSRVLTARDRLDGETRKRAAILLTERILGHQWFYRSDILLGFASYGSEINTYEILGEALRAGKKVYLPKVLTRVNGEPEMVFLRIYSLQELCPGYRGIPEPPEQAPVYCYAAEEAEKTLMLMPGVAFDRYRNRIGYGKGFYDRYLTDKSALWVRTIAAGFQCQMLEGRLPCGEEDIRPYQIICV